jgi:GNAT superfamily N-acetyltransferase
VSSAAAVARDSGSAPTASIDRPSGVLASLFGARAEQVRRRYPRAPLSAPSADLLVPAVLPRPGTEVPAGTWLRLLPAGEDAERRSGEPAAVWELVLEGVRGRLAQAAFCTSDIGLYAHAVRVADVVQGRGYATSLLPALRSLAASQDADLYFGMVVNPDIVEPIRRRGFRELPVAVEGVALPGRSFVMPR